MSETAESNAGMRRCACIPDGGGPRCAEPAAHSGWHRVGPLSWSPTPEPRTVPEWMVEAARLAPALDTTAPRSVQVVTPEDKE